MKKTGNLRGRARIDIRERQTLKTRKIVFYSVCGFVVVISLTVFFNLTDITLVKAKNVEIIQVEDQIFKNDIAIPEPEIRLMKVPDPGTVYIRKLKPLQ